jgi:hypothetical protein
MQKSCHKTARLNIKMRKGTISDRIYKIDKRQYPVKYKTAQ